MARLLSQTLYIQAQQWYEMHGIILVNSIRLKSLATRKIKEEEWIFSMRGCLDINVSCLEKKLMHFWMTLEVLTHDVKDSPCLVSWPGFINYLDQVQSFMGNSSRVGITPLRPSEISMKNWTTKVKSVLTHLWYKAMLKVWRKSPLGSTS